MAEIRGEPQTILVGAPGMSATVTITDLLWVLFACDAGLGAVPKKYTDTGSALFDLLYTYYAGNWVAVNVPRSMLEIQRRVNFCPLGTHHLAQEIDT